MHTTNVCRLVIFVVLATLMLCFGSAGAAIGHKRSTAFGSFGQPMDLMVDQSNGNVYVVDDRENAVDIFGAEGGIPSGGVITPFGGSAGLSFDFGGEEPSAVAIDESNDPADPSKGDLYVSDARHNVVDKFKLNLSGAYEYICRFTGYEKSCQESPSESPSWSEPDGVAVDSHGNVYIASYSPAAVSEFNAEGSYVTRFEGGDIEGPVGVAVDSIGDIYVNNFRSNVVKIDTGGHESFLDTHGAHAVAVDGQGDVFVDESSEKFSGANPRIAEYDQAGNEVDNFGAGIIGAPSWGLAVNNTTGNVYVSNLSNNDVEVFSQVVVPSVKTEGVSEVKGTRAKVSGSVNPESFEAHFFYEYGPCSKPHCEEEENNYPDKTPEEALANPTALVFETADASLVGLTPETTYHYRVVGVSANGEKQGKEEIFTTGLASSCSATNFRPVGVVLNGTVEPDGFETFYRFEYATDEEWAVAHEYKYFTGLETSSSEGQVAAAMAIEELEPGTKYHCRLFAADSEHGPTFGRDGTFTTPPALPTVDSQPLFATDVAPHEATLHGTISPGRGVTSYHFVYGPTTAYGAATEEAYTQFNASEVAIAHEGKEVTSYPAEQIVTGLSAGTVVHYALVATNATGTTVGSDHEFITLYNPFQPEELGGSGGPSLEVTSIPGIVQPSMPALLPTPVFPAIKPPSAPRHVKCKKGYVKKGGKCVKKPHRVVARRRK